MKHFLIVILIVAALLAIAAACAPQAAPEAQTEEESEELMELTLEQLKKFNGSGGNPAYVAIDDIIYDVTNVAPWAGGSHKGFTSGKDITKDIESVSPHGTSVVGNLIAVGRLVD